MAQSAKRVGTAGYWVAGGLVVIGIAATVGLGALGVTSIKAMAGPQYALPGRHEVRLDESGGYTVFHEITGAGRAGGLPPNLTITLSRKATGEPVALTPPTMNQTYTYGARQGAGVYRFDAPGPGVYVLEGRYAAGAPGPSVTVTIGRAAGLVKGVFGLLGACFTLAIFVIAALVVFIVTLVRRGKAKGRPAVAQPPPPAPPSA